MSFSFKTPATRGSAVTSSGDAGVSSALKLAAICVVVAARALKFSATRVDCWSLALNELAFVARDRNANPTPSTIITTKTATKYNLALPCGVTPGTADGPFGTIRRATCGTG